MPFYRDERGFKEFSETIRFYLPPAIIERGISFLEYNQKAEFLYNTEQLSRKHLLKDCVDHLTKNPSLKLIDYSNENLYILRDKGISEKQLLYLPILYHPRFIYPRVAKKYDISFIGSGCTRRMNIVKELMKKGYSVNIINTFDFDKKHFEIMQSKILLNIHFADDYKILETARCTVPLLNGQLVVSEDTDVTHEFGMNKKVCSLVFFTNYDNMVNKIIEMLNSYDSLQQKQYDLIENSKNEFESLAKNHIETFLSHMSE
jgi:hypothetical protein